MSTIAAGSARPRPSESAASEPSRERAWHAEPASAVLEALDSEAGGLAAHEAERRLQTHGPNRLPEAAARHPLMRFLAQFHNALIYFLLVAAVAAAALEHLLDAAVIVAVVLINAIVGFIQEGKAERALQAMRRMIAPHAHVMRDGARHRVPVETLVPGDVAIVEAGDRVPADLRLLHARGLLIDEAILTGESVAAQKHEKPTDGPSDLGDRHSMAYSGTLVAAGQASGVVVATGERTQIGRISTLLQSVEPLTTPLLRQINRFGRRFTVAALLFAAALFAFAVFVRGFDWAQALVAVVALSVGLIPEGLPAVITITLAIGVQRMAARQAVIRRLPAVETLGATGVICTDKTGTLTRNEMTARHLFAGPHTIEVSGAGYAPEGTLSAEGDASASIEAALPLVQCGVLCNDAQLRRHDGAWTVFGDPMEGALMALAPKAGIDPTAVRAQWPRLDEIPFDAAHRYMATLHRGPDGGTVAHVKGAPETVLAMAGLADDSHWQGCIDRAASAGERVLGFGSKPLDPGRENLEPEDLADGLQLHGLVGFIDPPREEALTAIGECHSAGIRVKMITGDHATTAAAIAHQLHLAEQPEAVTGAQLDAVSDDDLPELVRHATVFARTSPAHKLRIVQALQRDGEVVAMTGDGVNDAPSLKQADVGVAMGIKGTEAAKEASEMVLLDDNFASIVNAVHEGRTVYDNIRKVIAWTLPTNGGEALTLSIAILVGFTLPITAAQILWINLVTAVTLGLVLAFEPSEPDVMQRPPRASDAPLLSPFLLWRVGIVSVLFMAVCLVVFFNAQDRGLDVETARTMVVNTLVVMEVAYLFNVRFLRTRSITWRGALGTRPVLIALAVVITVQAAFTYLPWMNLVFESRPLPWADGGLILAAGLVLLLALEVEKAVLRRLRVFGELA